jgi:hypothetical protein
MFAFGSYVLGQLALWAGDDAAAKKWFYEALRLDPASEAGREVRILARRGTGTAGPPGEGEPSPRGASEEKASLVGREPGPATLPSPATLPVSAGLPAPAALPVPATRPGGPAPARRPNRWPRLLVPGAALLAAAGLVMFGATRSSMPRPGGPPVASFDPADSGSRDSVPGAEPPEATSDKASAGDDMGTVRLPSRASGHRIYVDGRRAQVDETAPLHLPCGPHVIQIGSRGTPQPIDLRCGGEVQLQ